MEADVARTGTIVVGVDGSESSMDALRWAAGQATLAQAPLEVVSAWSWPSAWGREPTWPPGFDPEEQTRTQLAEVVESVLGPGRRPDLRQIVVEGHAAEILVSAAEHAALLVVGRRGHGAFKDIFMGSVSMHCVANASCPVVVVRQRPEGG